MSCKKENCRCRVFLDGYCRKHFIESRKPIVEEPEQEAPIRCTVEGCSTQIFMNNLCKKHYYRMKLYGEADYVPISDLLGNLHAATTKDSIIKAKTNKYVKRYR